MNTQLNVANDEILTGTVNNDYLYGGNGDDYIVGNLGDDILVGGAGNDNLVGYGGGAYEYDELIGGSGADLFILGSSPYGSYYVGAGYAVIQDFSWQEGDYIAVGSDINEYSLLKDFNFVGGSAADTAIYKGNDLIAIVQDTTNVIASQDFIIWG
jgi:hypothetical protein